MAYKGRFSPQNPSKYKGDPSNIIYRSLWELKFFRYIDVHPDVVWWQSEELSIPYRDPLNTGKIRRYYPDVLLKKKVGDAKYEIVMIEIKPQKQTQEPDIRNKNKTPTGRISRRYLNEVKTYGYNKAKWDAARKYCAERGWAFSIFSEKDLGIK
jgi:hypothetical protein